MFKQKWNYNFDLNFLFQFDVSQQPNMLSYSAFPPNTRKDLCPHIQFRLIFFNAPLAKLDGEKENWSGDSFYLPYRLF